MGKLIRFEEGKARYARVDLDSTDPIWISVAQTGVLVKRSRLGFLGTTFDQESSLVTVVAHCRHLDTLLGRPSVSLSDPVLAPYACAALNSRDLAALSAVLSVPPLLETTYTSERHFQVLQRFVNRHGTLLQQTANATFGFSEKLLPLPSRTIGEMLLIYALAVFARNALTPEVQLTLRFAYGHLALALSPARGAEAATVTERLARGDTSVEQEPAWDRVRRAAPALLESQTEREREFDRRLIEACGVNRVVNFGEH